MSEKKNSMERSTSLDEDGKIKTKDDKRKIKQYRDLVEKEEVKFPSVFDDWEKRYDVFSHLPTTKLRKVKKNPKVMCSVSGPMEPIHPHDIFAPYVCGRSISTYPHVPGKPKRDGDPVCDSYSIQILEENVVIGVVADGCNWGKRPMDASNAAKDAFAEYLRNHLHLAVELRDVGHFLLRAISYCHHKIIEGKEDIWEAGTTTLLGGVLLRLKKPKEDAKKEQCMFVCVSIGDCKAYFYSVASNTIRDITAGNRKNVYDARDCGGRLGPYVGEGSPDLRNVAVYYTECEENDLILIVSDGVHDNLDPQILGVAPKDVDEKYAGFTSLSDWKSFASEDEVEKMKTQHMLKLLSSDIIKGSDKEKELRQKILSFAVSDEESPTSPHNITTRIMKHCLNVTGKGREWMEQNPKEKLPMDYESYPGKMDHATSVIIKVGDYEKSLFKLLEKK